MTHMIASTADVRTTILRIGEAAVYEIVEAMHVSGRRSVVDFHGLILFRCRRLRMSASRCSGIQISHLRRLVVFTLPWSGSTL